MTLDKAAATANAALNIEWWQGLRNGNLMLHYQPQMACDGRMSGVEALVRWCAGALVRWQHPQSGLVFPQEFIFQAEVGGLILPLGKWVPESARNRSAEHFGKRRSPAVYAPRVCRSGDAGHPAGRREGVKA